MYIGYIQGHRNYKKYLQLLRLVKTRLITARGRLIINLLNIGTIQDIW